jgi:hypothetical protein
MTTTSIVCENDTYVLKIPFQENQHSIECWLPLTNNEPSNKKNKTGSKLKFRKIQNSRGKYYQMNGGDSTHVYFYKQKWGDLKTDGRWNYHVSHLCHHWWCCNPDHLVYEPEWVNQLRKCCCATYHINCDCDEAYHPQFNDQLYKCIWYTSNTLSDLDKKNSDFMVLNLSENDTARFDSKCADVRQEIKGIVDNVNKEED